MLSPVNWEKIFGKKSLYFYNDDDGDDEWQWSIIDDEDGGEIFECYGVKFIFLLPNDYSLLDGAWPFPINYYFPSSCLGRKLGNTQWTKNTYTKLQIQFSHINCMHWEGLLVQEFCWFHSVTDRMTVYYIRDLMLGKKEFSLLPLFASSCTLPDPAKKHSRVWQPNLLTLRNKNDNQRQKESQGNECHFPTHFDWRLFSGKKSLC